MTQRFDLIVIGTGEAATTAAHKCRAAGWSVAVIDYRPFGGTCALRGCDPKKVLVGAAELVDWSRRMQGKGISDQALSIDWPQLMHFKRTFTDPVPAGSETGFKKAGIQTFHGKARFIDQTTLKVADETLSFKYGLIATGATPARLGISGEEYLTYSDQFLELDQLPGQIIFVGGGYIAFEFTHVSARAGAQVTVLHRGNHPLEGFDPDLVDKLAEATRKLGVDLRLGTTVEAIEKKGNQLIVHTSSSGSKLSFEADMVVHAAGRVPEIDDLDLEKAGVKRENQGVSVNEYLQSVSNPAIYAAGDAAASGGYKLTPVAGMEGGLVASNLLKGNHSKPDFSGVPTVVFTIPSLASVGLKEAEARGKGLDFKVKYEDTSEWYSSRRVNLQPSAYKVLIEEGSGKILGAHLLGYHAEEVINIFGLAIRNGLTSTDLKHNLYAYPTSGSDVIYMV